MTTLEEQLRAAEAAAIHYAQLYQRAAGVLRAILEGRGVAQKTIAGVLAPSPPPMEAASAAAFDRYAEQWETHTDA